MDYKVELITTNGTILVKIEKVTKETYQLHMDNSNHFLEQKQGVLKWETDKGYVMIPRERIVAINTIITNE